MNKFNQSHFFVQSILNKLVGKTNYEVLGTLCTIHSALKIANVPENISKEEVVGAKFLLAEEILKLKDTKKNPSDHIFIPENIVENIVETEEEFLANCL